MFFKKKSDVNLFQVWKNEKNQNNGLEVFYDNDKRQIMYKNDEGSMIVRFDKENGGVAKRIYFAEPGQQAVFIPAEADMGLTSKVNRDLHPDFDEMIGPDKVPVDAGFKKMLDNGLLPVNLEDYLEFQEMVESGVIDADVEKVHNHHIMASGEVQVKFENLMNEGTVLVDTKKCPEFAEAVKEGRFSIDDISEKAIIKPVYYVPGNGREPIYDIDLTLVPKEMQDAAQRYFTDPDLKKLVDKAMAKSKPAKEINR